MSSVQNDFNNIILDYLSPFQNITKFDIDDIKRINSDNHDFINYKIINNKLYQCNHINHFNERIDSFNFTILKTLEKYKISDCEFIVFVNDGINDRNIHTCVSNGRILPVIVSTSVLDKYNMILCPDSTFSFVPSYGIRNNEEMCRNVINFHQNFQYKNKINKLVWRGSSLPPYRRSYLRNDEYFDVQNGGFRNNYLSNREKSLFKYQLHLNGHGGNNHDGAYSIGFKWALMGNSTVLYSAPNIYREFWYHSSIFREGEHFVYSRDMFELEAQYEQLLLNPKKSEIIASNGFNFFVKYLLEFDNIMYYMQRLFNEYSSRQNFISFVNVTDTEINNTYMINYMKKYLQVNNL